MRETDCRICVLDNLQASYAASVLFSVTLEPMPSLPEREAHPDIMREVASRDFSFLYDVRAPFLELVLAVVP
jgi:hypothetical protein